MSSPFPPEILYEIALHLPLTDDVIALSRTSHAVRRAISTPVLFKARLLSQGWDIDTWQDEDDKAQRSAHWKHWIRIDYIHSNALQLLEDASTGGLSPPLVDSGPSSLTLKLLTNWVKKKKKTPELRIIGNIVIHLGKAKAWCQRLSKVFPILIAHHRVNNILHITETNCGALRAYMMAVTEIYLDMLTHWEKSHKFPGRSSVGLQERACFGLAAFVMQCNAETIETICGDHWTEGSPDFVAGLFSRLRLDAMALYRYVGFRHYRDPTDFVGTSMQYSTSFLVQIEICLGLHFRAARSPLSLFPPSIPPMNLASEYDEPFELGSDDISWPWLRNGLAGTPLARLSSVSGDRWAGYYTYSNILGEPHDPPMFFKFELVPPPAISGAAHKVYFLGEGADSAGSFFLEGSADTHTGAVVARKSYVGAHWWSWNGLLTPFGMVGVWGIDAETYGWWWIWPQEWSERSPASQAAVSMT